MYKTLPLTFFNGFFDFKSSLNRHLVTAFGIFTILLASQTATAQIPGNPYVDAGPDQTIDCNSSGCTDITATFLQIGETNTYTVSSIQYLPPSDFTGLGNQLNPNIDDRWTTIQQLPFDFCFFGNINTNYQVGTNGVIAFEPTASNFNGWSFSQNLPNNSNPTLGEANIFSPCHDMDPTRSEFEEIGFEVQGVAPNRVLVVAFAEVPMFQCNNIFATQMMVLYETTNIIDVYINTKPTCNTWNSGNAVIGIQNNDGTVAFVPPGRQTSDSPWSTVNEAWRFTPAGPSIVSFAWLDSTGAVIGTTPTLNVCPSGSEIYTAQVTYTSCNGDIVVVEDDVMVSSNATFTVDAGEDFASCTAASTVLTATVTGIDPTLVTYLWSTGETTQSITVTMSGTYTVDVTGNGCTISDSVNVDFNAAPILDLGNDINSCLEIGNTVVLDATPSNVPLSEVTFVWALDGNVLPGETSATLIPTATGTYMVTVTNGNCVTTDTVTITPVDFTVDLGDDIEACLGNPPTLTANLTVYTAAQVTFEWMLDGNVLTGETSQTLLVTQAGTYTVTVTAGDCVETDTIVVSAIPEILIDLGEDIASCLLDPITLDASPSNYNPALATYEWSFNGTVIPGETNPTLTVTQNGTYSVVVTIDACSTTDTININPGEDILFDLGADFDSCFQQPSVLDATPSNYDPTLATYEWSLNGTVIPGETNATLTVTQNGTYSVTVTIGSCENTDTITINATEFTVSLGGDIQSCFEENVILTASLTVFSVSETTFQWFLDGNLIAGETNSTLPVNQTGTYTVVATVGNCEATDTIVVGPGDLTVDLGPDITTCFENGIEILTATITGYDESQATFEWYMDGILIAGETTSTLDVTESGLYTVIVTVGVCTAQDSIVVNEREDLVVVLGADIQTCPNEPNVLIATTSEQGVTFQWFLNGTLLPNETGNSITVVLPSNTLGSQNYTVVISSGQCSGSDSIEVSLYGSGNCVISQGISPNGSPGFNDILDLTFLANRTGISKLQIYNRLGRVVFERANYTNEWRGQSKEGNDLPTGTYFYVIDLNGNDSVYGAQASGWIYLNQDAN